jgi:hypothetical protein
MSSESGNTCLADLGGDAEDFVVVFGGVQAHRLVQHRPRVVAHVHGGVHRQQEEADPQQVAAAQQVRAARA